MVDDLTGRLDEIFTAAFELTPEKREEFLLAKCGDDEALLARLRSLLAHHDQAEDFLEKPALKTSLDIGAVENAGRASLEAGESQQYTRLEGQRIGAYRIARLIGSGGMSDVYLAERADESFEKNVALKVIRPGMDATLVASRFFLERQVLAALDHPNIARLLDGGATDQQLPFLVMELVDGVPLDEYCRAENLGVEERIRLFLEVCTAVEAAHQNLILHRDLKPRNVLVTAEGRVKLLDFGISKLMERRTLEAGTATRSTQRFYTPEYASPEQIQGRISTTASDVYSLGVILFELITGKRPHDVKGLPFEEAERKLCSEQACRPSASVAGRAGDSLDSGGLSQRRGIESRDLRTRRLQRRLRGDLDAITLKALRKDPRHRYASVGDLSGDLHRYLSGLPVSARRGTFRYCATRFLCRHRRAVVSVLLVLGLVAVTVVFAFRDASRDRQKETALEMARLLGDVFGSRTSVLTGRDDLLRSLEAQRALETANQLRGQPRSLAEFAESIARLCEGRHLWRNAADWWGLAAQGLEDSKATVVEHLAVHSRLALAHEESFLFGKAIPHLRKCLDLLGSSRLGSARDNNDRGSLLWRLGRAYGKTGNVAEARAAFKNGERWCRARDDRQIVLIDLLLHRASFRLDLMGIEAARGDAMKALELSRQQKTLVREAQSLQTLAAVIWRTRSFTSSEVYLRQASSLLLKALPETSPEILDCEEAMITWRSKALYSSEHLRRVLERRRTLSGVDSVAYARTLLLVCWRLQALIDVTFLADRAEAILARRLPVQHPMRVAARIEKGRSELREGGDPRLAEELLRSALGQCRIRLPEGHWTIARASSALALALSRQGRHEEAIELAQRSLEDLERVHGPLHHDAAEAMSNTGKVLENAGRMEAARELRESLSGSPGAEWLGPHVRDDRGKRGKRVSLDFEDDYAEKRFLVNGIPDETREVRLWIYGQAFHWAWGRFTNEETHVLQVNHDRDQEVRFNPGILFGRTHAFRWTPVVLPRNWIREGMNTVAIYLVHHDDYENTQPWSNDNLWLGIDSQVNHDRSWWFSGLDSCCEEMGLAAFKAPKPLPPESLLIGEHRECGFRECDGELMMILEFVLDE